MIMLRSTHNAEVAHRDEVWGGQIARLVQLVEAKDEQIADLRRLVFLPKAEPIREVMEADSVMSASEKPIDVSEEEQSRMLGGMREMDLIVSGNYDMDLLN